MYAGLQTHFGSVIGVDLLRAVAARGFQMARVDAQKVDTAEMLTMISECELAGLRPLVIVSRPEPIGLLAGLDVELGNEHDPGGIGEQQTPAVYRARLDQACKAASHAGVRLWAPALSNLDENSLKWLNQVKGPAWPEGLYGISVHRYGDGTFEKPHAGFTTRDREVYWLKVAAAGRPLLISEFGYPNKDSITEQQAAERITKEWAFWERHGAYAAILYQINDGQASAEKYGIRRVDGTWKPSADTVPGAAPVPLPPPQPIVVGPSYAAFAVVAQTSEGQAIPDAAVLVSTDGRQGRTNVDGYVVFEALEQKPLTFSVHKPGFKDYFSEPLDLAGNLQVVVKLESSIVRAGEHGQLRVQGRDFIDEIGQPWQFRGYTMHYLINKAVEGADLDAILDEPIELTANVVIGIGLHASPWKTEHGWRCTPMEHPEYFQKLGALFDRCEDRKIRIAHAPWADAQYMPASFDRQWFWRESCAVMRGRWNVIARKGNESKHNGWSEDDYPYPDMAGVLCSQGSKGGEENPHVPYLNFCEFELRRDLPKMFVDAPLRQLMDGDFPGPATNRPTVSIEPIFFHDTNPDHVGDSRCTDPRVALELGLLTGPCAGGAFGASDGMECKRLQPRARKCAEEYFRGLTAGFVRPLAALDFQGAH